MRHLHPAFLLAAPLLFCGCVMTYAPHSVLGQGAGAPPCAQAKAPVSDGWVTLFDGKDASAWRGYGTDGFPGNRWKVEEDGTLHGIPIPHPERETTEDGCDLITRESYGDFELVFEFKRTAETNSGVFYRLREQADEPVYAEAFEYQIIDESFADYKVRPSTSTGALYSLYEPVGAQANEKWNIGRIVARGPVLEHWLNGKLVMVADTRSEDFRQRMGKSKFPAWPEYGAHKEGPIGLQDEGTEVWYRTIKVRRLAP